ncbi:hypothetical protein E2C01_020781 [Portunus trituberculatus]|uniref:Uncharacterized protein n=1 Tax=Portunus trituberculatus TaxID=210409 RepID=A0A5B7E2P8_PORTR|nr:hypothetical protein [Portunus trituberculatus]
MEVEASELEVKEKMEMKNSWEILFFFNVRSYHKTYAPSLFCFTQDLPHYSSFKEKILSTTKSPMRVWRAWNSRVPSVNPLQLSHTLFSLHTVLPADSSPH